VLCIGPYSCLWFRICNAYAGWVNKTKFLIPYEQLYIPSHRHHK
jgi:hypothetical protein